jgi:hypothetical protein
MHITSVVSTLYKDCQTIRVLYPNVDKSEANVGEKTFVKSPARIELLKNKAPDTPPSPSNSSNYTFGNLIG